MQKVDNLTKKLKILRENLLKQPVQIPQMGFYDHTIHNAALVPDNYINLKSRKEKIDDDSVDSKENCNSTTLSDQEILESTEAIYFSENVDTGIYEIKKLAEENEDFDVNKIESTIVNLKGQHRVISKRVLQLILEKRNDCNVEFKNINETEKIVQESVWVCQKARSYLNFAKKNLTTSSLEILAAYKKRQTLKDVLEILKFFQELKSLNQNVQDMLHDGNYSEAISILLSNKNQTEKYSEYTCTESLKLKLQETLDVTEVSLDNALNGITQNKFDPKLYENLMNAYKLLGKTHLAIDQLQMNFISSIHTTAFNVLKENLIMQQSQKLLFEQMCENLSHEHLVPCLAQLCKSFWTILVCYQQVTHFHQNHNLSKINRSEDDLINEEYIHEKIMKGQTRIWNDIQGKMCIFISTTKISHLKHENFIKVLSIVQRMKKVGSEFSDDSSQKMIDAMKQQSVEFFKRYHSSCLDEISLFLEHEIWIQVMSFSSVTQLQEFRMLKRALNRHNNIESCSNTSAVLTAHTVSPSKRSRDLPDDSSLDESSIYGSCGYFVRFSEKSSPFENLYDQRMIEEDILAGVADETSCYYSEDSSDNDNEMIKVTEDNESSTFTINNTSLNLLRIIGRYLQMCRLLYAISTHIIYSMIELIDFYVYSVYELFAKDLPMPGDALHSPELEDFLKRIPKTLIPKIRKWPLSTQMIEMDLKDPEQFYGLAKRINAVESCKSIVQQVAFLHGYLDHLIEATKSSTDEIDNERQSLRSCINDISKCIDDVKKPIFTCVTSRAIDIKATLSAMNKVKWDINHVTTQHNSYVDLINRASQLFALRLEELNETMTFSKDALWDSYSHVVTHVLVEGYSSAKKCTPAGRALMMLDFTHFLSILEVLSGMKHPIHQLYVDKYLKAFYLGCALEDFIKTQNGYSSKHLIGLINCSCSDKKLRQKLLSLVENSN